LNRIAHRDNSTKPTNVTGACAAMEKGIFEDQDQFMRSIQKRAEFENKPIDKEVYSQLRANIKIEKKQPKALPLILEHVH